LFTVLAKDMQPGKRADSIEKQLKAKMEVPPQGINIEAVLRKYTIACRSSLPSIEQNYKLLSKTL
jgi:hypothetical protein